MASSSSLSIALVGTGQMGQAVEAVAQERGHTIVRRFDRETPLPTATQAALPEAEVAIDFTLPETATDHLAYYCNARQPAVIGTTGWYDALPQVRSWVEAHEGRLLYAPNFSIGVALLVRALRGVLPLLEDLPAYDAFVHEIHHTNKVDSPSGTAEMLGNEIIDALSRKTHQAIEAQHGAIPPDALHVSSTRVGQVFGQHTIGFDSAFDQLTLRHEAKGREGFAFGAVRAAEWLVQQRSGLFTLDDMLDTVL
ncbi:MAG: 4-hydroxy-tetrahydrodipicolinate reductase [Bacteroidetes bacterium]|nr:4-hydroxy-tetrahydrodipicolinate reductase [Bacteroidota bacterium]